MPFAIKPNSTVLFTGDSITDAGRRDSAIPIGGGYVRMVSDLVAARYPEHGLRVVNTGIGGNTIEDLQTRFTDDVISHRPDWVSIMIGINDVNRWLCKQPGSVSPEQYADFFAGIMDRLARETTATVVLVEPFYLSRDGTSGSYRSRVLTALADYRKTVHAMAEQHKARLVRLHEMFQNQLRHHPVDRFAPEPVHPNPSGHLLIAHEWLRAVDW